MNRYPMILIMETIELLAKGNEDGETTLKNRDINTLIDWATYSRRKLLEWEASEHDDNWVELR